MKIAHLSDTHIKNLKYHYEYRVAFDDLYQKLREEKPDYIVHCGDIAHTKTQISPEFVEMCSNFLSNLADIAPTVVILGNHDGNLRNSSRQDAITPIVAALDHKNLHLLKNSGEFSLDNIVTFNVLSVFDEDNWVDPSDSNKINVALYHGNVSGAGVKTDTGWLMQYGDHHVSVFEEHDYAFLGDIHKTNQILNEEGTIRYCGSTIQQNFGESSDKGFLLWDIDSKKDFTCRHIELYNPRPFIDLELTSDGKFLNNSENIPEKARIRLIAPNNLPINVVRKAIDVARHRFSAESVSYVSRENGETKVGKTNLKNSAINLRDPKVQEGLIKDYLEDFSIEDDLMDRVISLNHKYTKMAEESESVLRNINWRIRSLEWHNLFNYGENNYIDFDKLSGIVGIFGKNYSGKSSVIDSLLYTLYNTTSKNERKSVNIINQNQEACAASLHITSGNKDYVVNRTSEKYSKKVKGEVVIEAKTVLDFDVTDAITGETKSLNGNTRNQTDAIIRRNFGTVDDFALTSMSSQFGALNFIDEGSTRRKEILAKFLDLELFEKKFKLAKEDSADTKGALKKLEKESYEDELQEAESDLAHCRVEMQEHKDLCKSYKEKIESSDKLIEDIQEKIDSIPSDIADVGKLKLQLKDKERQLFAIGASISENQTIFKENKTKKEKLDKLLKGIDIEYYREKYEEIESLNQNITDSSIEVESKKRQLRRCEEKVGLLNDIPCGTKYATCKFISDAYAAKARIPNEEAIVTNLEKEICKANTRIEDLNPKEVQETIKKYDQAFELLDTVERLSESAKLTLSRDKEIKIRIEGEIGELSESISLQEENKEIIENFEELSESKRLAQAQKDVYISEEDSCNETLMGLNRSIGSLEQKVESAQQNIKDLRDLREEYSAYDLYMRAMHPNGIAYSIIKNKLPVINDEISKVLANIVSFQVFFENDEKRLNIYIKHPDHEPRPLEMGSGAEKSIAAMAIRLSLLSVSSLPKSDVFILDEPGTAFDESNMEGFVRILNLIKVYFKTVVLVTHLEGLKDCVDTQITIEKIDGYANVRVE